MHTESEPLSAQELVAYRAAVAGLIYCAMRGFANAAPADDRIGVEIGLETMLRDGEITLQVTCNVVANRTTIEVRAIVAVNGTQLAMLSHEVPTMFPLDVVTPPPGEAKH